MQKHKRCHWKTDAKSCLNYVLKLKTCPNDPAYSCVFEPPNSKLFEKSELTPPRGLLVLPLFEDSKTDLGVVDDVTVSDTPPWRQPEPHICLSLTKFKKDCTSPDIYKRALLDVTSQHQNYVEDFYGWFQSRWEGFCCSSIICCPK